MSACNMKKMVMLKEGKGQISYDNADTAVSFMSCSDGGVKGQPLLSKHQHLQLMVRIPTESVGMVERRANN